jgi:hypothetical protein
VGCDARLIGFVQGRFAFLFGGALPSLDNPPPDEPGKRDQREQGKKREYAFQKAPRCTAKSKKTGQRCKAPAERG